MSIIAVIQARMGSTRLPGKVMMTLADKPVLAHDIERVHQCRSIDEVVVATTTLERDKEIIDLCASVNTRVFTGSEEDVLDRYFQTAKAVGADHIVRITSDCPMIDPDVVDMIIGKHLEKNVDYTSNTAPRSFPKGLDTEVFTAEALNSAWEEAGTPYEREHVTPYIRNHPERFTIQNVNNPVDYSQKRWTLDEKADYEFISAVYDEIYSPGRIFRMKDVLALLEAKPHLETINSMVR